MVRILQRFPSLVGVEATGMVLAYSTDLARFPDWAIDEAMSRVVEGRSYGTGAFPPTAPELVKLCLEATSRVEHEIRSIEVVLKAEVYIEQPKEHREAMKARFAGLIQDLADAARKDLLNKAKPVLPTRIEAEANLELMAEGLPQMPVKLSPEVLKKFHQGR